MTERDVEKLAELARRTEHLRPTPGFVDAVMAAIEDDAVAPRTALLASLPSSRPPRSAALSEGVSRSGVVAVLVAAVAAAACVVLSIDAQSRFDEAVLLSVDAVEVDE